MELPIITLVTGANSGLGYAIACRVVLEFLDQSGTVAGSNCNRRLVLCLTTRSSGKARIAIANLTAFLTSRLSEDAFRRVQLDHITIDLSSIVSVMAAATELRRRYSRIHHVFCNAAVVPFIRIDWLKAVHQFATGFVDAMTVPRYKVQNIGWVTDAHQALLVSQPASTRQPTLSELGAAFTANVFGHYFLLHEIMQLLHSPINSHDGPSRIIWIGSIESDPLTFNIEDLQGIKATKPYESSKTLIDILVLGCHLPETEKYYRSYTTPPQDGLSTFDSPETNPPIFLIAHPGIISTEIVAVPWWQSRAKIIGFQICKFLGSPWHCIDPFIGANAPVWLALSPHVEMIKGVKWGSGCNWGTGEFVLETRVEANITSHASRLWDQMENLRMLWKSRLVALAQT
ncbi:hypothetical protein AA313_de0200883 [Arthrobotrys entomopaga]|nr:hypothetical protein AA313_de0200883 [Arthrobotrys entomopaga]